MTFRPESDNVPEMYLKNYNKPTSQLDQISKFNSLDIPNSSSEIVKQHSTSESIINEGSYKQSPYQSSDNQSDNIIFNLSRTIASLVVIITFLQFINFNFYNEGLVDSVAILMSNLALIVVVLISSIVATERRFWLKTVLLKILCCSSLFWIIKKCFSQQMDSRLQYTINAIKVVMACVLLLLVDKYIQFTYKNRKDKDSKQ